MRCDDCPALAYIIHTQCLPHTLAYVIAGRHCSRTAADLRAEAAQLRSAVMLIADALDAAAEAREREEAQAHASQA